MGWRRQVRPLLALPVIAMVALAACEDRNYNPGVFSATSGAAPAASEPADAAAAGGAAAGSASDVGASAADGGAGTSADPGASANAGQSGGASDQGNAPRTLDIPKPLDGGAATTGVTTPISGGAVVVAPGEEPYQKLAQDRKFEEFRRRSASYVEICMLMRPLGEKLADNSATDAERAEYYRLEKRAEQLFRPLNNYMWEERWSESDRAAMGWILYGNLQKPR